MAEMAEMAEIAKVREIGGKWAKVVPSGVSGGNGGMDACQLAEWFLDGFPSNLTPHTHLLPGDGGARHPLLGLWVVVDQVVDDGQANGLQGLRVLDFATGVSATSGKKAEWQNGRMAERQNGRMAEWQK